jgi:hypothetical protein
VGLVETGYNVREFIKASKPRTIPQTSSKVLRLSATNDLLLILPRFPITHRNVGNGEG